MKRLTEMLMCILDNTLYNEKNNSRICWTLIAIAIAYIVFTAIRMAL